MSVPSLAAIRVPRVSARVADYGAQSRELIDEFHSCPKPELMDQYGRVVENQYSSPYRSSAFCAEPTVRVDIENKLFRDPIVTATSQPVDTSLGYCGTTIGNYGYDTMGVKRDYGMMPGFAASTKGSVDSDYAGIELLHAVGATKDRPYPMFYRPGM